MIIKLVLNKDIITIAARTHDNRDRMKTLKHLVKRNQMVWVLV